MRQFLRRAWYLLRRHRFEADLAEEMSFHREMAEHELQRTGLDPADASTSARRAFGSAALAADQARDVWIPAGLRDLSHDLRFAFRLSVKDPWFTVVAVATLALGIGFNS